MADEESMGDSLHSSGKKINYNEQSEDVNGRLKSVSDNEPSSSKSVSSKKKKKKKKAKKECCDDDHCTMDACAGGEHGTRPNANQIKDLQKFLDAMKIDGKPPKTAEEAKKKKYLFWDTQPVPKIDEEVQEFGAIEEDKTIAEIRQDPYSLPEGFEWDTLDISNSSILKELYTLLNENYVEDDDNMFRFDYSSEFLVWALKPPGWKMQWHCGVRVASNKKLVGFISAIPAHVRIHSKTILMVEINFLCVHKKLRSKRVAPVLIREITRRVNMEGIFQAVYTAGVVLPKPVACCRYWHRSLNPKKLIDVKFSHLSRHMTMQRTVKLYRLPEEPETKGIKPLSSELVMEAYQIVSEYLKKFHLAPEFTEDEFKHWFLPREGIINSYTIQNDENKVTGFISFYTLPSTVMHHPVHKQLKAAYSFYNVSNDVPLLQLMQDALILAKQAGFDVFNALDLMDNKEFLEKLKFGIGDGNLQYYLYNWKCPLIDPDKTGLVLQ
ncbi:glycylpeptide N-tetradecanoyltransferase 2 [Exaiptasia diaphana]|uniref:Glycylpeptide N-tetradecanoyltransferase n=1 Tax=Exaiptasia diaphana TaxID=2652724 RepID=A0A913YAK1_EXADI|nr:glycylpeptide N-tetradecanoyltransferase 2 [Exaiptasia diaphana]KXJ28238.1 Glycylpeptide N-tetradecanoyltransferase 2 [Exaiptasia diaphana]